MTLVSIEVFCAGKCPEIAVLPCAIYDGSDTARCTDSQLLNDAQSDSDYRYLLLGEVELPAFLQWQLKHQLTIETQLILK